MVEQSIDNISKRNEHENIIGTVTSDDVSPSFEIFRFKAKHGKYVSPGVWLRHQFLLIYL